jgi:leader peptidase (prepilin peptidase) / N-methyltransferase
VAAYHVPEWFELGGFLLGLLFGSFLNVCISRLPAHQSIVHPRSRCTRCSHTIRWYDNMPILSWLLLRARCRDCKARISWRYPAVELAVGLWFTWVASEIELLWSVNQPDGLALMHAVHAQPYTLAHQMPLFLGEATLGFLLIGLMVMDWQTQRLPDAFTLTGIAIGFVLTCVQAFFLPPGQGDIKIDTTHQLRMSSPGSFASQGNVFMTGTEAMIWERILAICGAALLLFTISAIYKAARKRDGMGMGDVKLLAMITAFLGFGESLLALFIGVASAAAYGIILLARRRAHATTRLPFGSFLCAGGLFAALFGPRIVDWYTNLLR